MFEGYLREQGYAIPEHEPDLGVAKRPDYLVERDGLKCVCEIKEFDRETTSTPGLGTGGKRFGSFDSETVLKPVRSQIRRAASQLKPLAGSGLPLMVVIANPHGAWVDTSDRQVIAAMFGDPTVAFTINTETGAAEGDARFEFGRNGKLRADHPYISAVGFVRERARAADVTDKIRRQLADASPKERMAATHEAEARGELPDGAYHRMDVFGTVSPDALPVPDGLFDAPMDRLFAYDPEAGMYGQVRGPTFG